MIDQDPRPMGARHRAWKRSNVVLALAGVLGGFGLGFFVHHHIDLQDRKLAETRGAFAEGEFERALHEGLMAAGDPEPTDPAKARLLNSSLAQLPRLTLSLARGQSDAAYSADGRWLLLAGSTASLHDAQTGIEVPWLAERRVLGAQFMPDGKRLLARTEDGVELRGVTDGERHGLFARGELSDLVVSTPDGSMVITLGRRYIRAWMVDTGLETLRLEAAGADSAQLSHDGRWLAVAPGLGGDLHLRIYDIRSGRQVAAFPLDEALYPWAWRPGKAQLAVGSSSHLELFEVTGERRMLHLPQPRIRQLAFSPDGTLLAVATDEGQVHLWSVDGDQLHRTLHHPAGVASMAFSSDGHWLLTGGTETIDEDYREIRDFRVRRWRVADGVLRQSARLRDEVSAVAFRRGPNEFIALADSVSANVFTVDDPLDGRDLLDYGAARDVLHPDMHEALSASDHTPGWKTRASEVANECDRLAAHPGDAQRLAGGIPEAAIPAGRARSACEAALLASPDEPRVRYQLGRAMAAWGDPTFALSHYRWAAEMGYARAQGALAEHLLAQDIAQLRTEGMNWLRRAAEAGDPPAMLAMAERSDDADEARNRIERAAKAGLAAAHASLALSEEREYLARGSASALARAFRAHSIAARLAGLNGEWALAERSAMRRASLASLMEPARVISVYREAVRWEPDWTPPDER
jgi:hypothetical protein